MTPRDLALWRAARPWLDVRANDVHTLIAWRLARTLLALRPGADEAVVLPAIILHDTGWKRMPQDKLAKAVGPNPQFPELQRDHELAGVEIGSEILRRLGLGLNDAAILGIVDGHDTTRAARSPEDAVVKDADKLWRFTPHGVATIGGWFGTPAPETLAMLEDFVLPSLLTPEARIMAQGFLAEGWAAAEREERMNG
ncbi:MAG: HD domain-containing protein [Rhodobacteraceae bacterium]|nr:HD domain-containing protein [Paracoccaceae bacterium]